MATNNIRVVGYLPPPYHEKLREYMQAQSLTESAAIVAIIKQFFDGTTGTRSALIKKDDASAELKADMAQLQRRLSILEEAFVSGKHLKSAKRTSHQYGPPPVLPPQTLSELARRLGVSAATVESAAQKGEAYFRDWSKQKDPAKRSWLHRGELFYPLSD